MSAAGGLDFTRFARRQLVLERAEARVAKLRGERDDEIAELRVRLGIVRLGLSLASYDVLANVVVEDGHWRWPRFNGQGTPVAYSYVGGRRSYRGAASAVHEAALGCQHQDSYKPICGHRWCVHPAHRCGVCHARAHRR